MSSKDEHEENSARVKDLTPMTIRQIKSSSQLHSKAPFLYEGRRVDNILLVAVVNFIRADSNAITLRFDDSTSGNMYGKKYLDDCDLGRQDELLEGITEGMYVRVWARLTSGDSGGKVPTSLIVEQVRPVTDFHELFYHVFNVAAAHNARRMDDLPQPDGDAVNVTMDVGEAVGTVAVAVADAYVPSREVSAQQRGRPARMAGNHADAASLHDNEDDAYFVVTLDHESTSMSIRAPPPEPEENEPEPPESVPESDLSRSCCSTIRHDSDGNVVMHSPPDSSGSDVYLTGSEGESMDIDGTYDENGRGVRNPLVNTHSAPGPELGAAATATLRGVSEV